MLQWVSISLKKDSNAPFGSVSQTILKIYLSCYLAKVLLLTMAAEKFSIEFQNSDKSLSVRLSNSDNTIKATNRNGWVFKPKSLKLFRSFCILITPGNARQENEREKIDEACRFF